MGAANLLHHWQLALLAGAVGLCAGPLLLAAAYLAPLFRLRLTPPEDRDRVGRLLAEGRATQRRLEDLLAVYEEHGHPEACELRRDAEVGVIA